MEPFNLALSQVNFDEQDITGDDDLNSFNNLCHYDSDFQHGDTDGKPVIPRRILPGATSEPPAQDLDSIIKKNIGASYLHDAYNADTVVASDEANPVGLTQEKSAVGYIHSYYYQGVPGQQNPNINTVQASGVGVISNKGSQSQQIKAKGIQESPEMNQAKSLAFDPHEDSFVAFTDTVEALALQKSVIGTSSVTPAPEDEVARVIAETQARMMKAASANDSMTSNSLHKVSNTVVSEQADQHSMGNAVSSTEAASTSKSSVLNDDDDSILISMTQEQYTLSQGSGNQAANQIEVSASHAQVPTNQNSHDTSAANQNSVSNDVAAAATVTRTVSQKSETIEQHTASSDSLVHSPGGTVHSPGGATAQDLLHSPVNGHSVELIRIPADQITTVTEKKGSWFSSSKSSSSSPKSTNLSAEKHTEKQHAASEHADLSQTSVESDAVEPGATMQSNTMESGGEQGGVITESGAKESKLVESGGEQGGIVVESGAMQSSVVESTRFVESATAHSSSVESTSTLSVASEQITQVIESHGDVQSSLAESSKSQAQDNVSVSTELSGAGTVTLEKEYITGSTHVETSSVQLKSASETTLSSASHTFDATDGKQRHSSQNAPVLYPLTPLNSQSARNRENIQVESSHVESHHTERHSHVEHVKRVIEYTESSTIGDVPDTPNSSFNADLINKELDQMMREKAKLEGQVEVMAAELKVVIKERAELQTQLGALEQQLKSQESSTQGIMGNRDAMEASIKTLRQNRARLELVVMDAQKLLEDKDGDIKTLHEDLELAKEANDKLQDKIGELNAHLQGRDSTVEDLKSKVAELYVEYQTTNQNKILADSEVKSLEGEITSLKTGKEWYQDQLHLSQQAKSDLQKQVTEVKGEMIMMGTFIEKLKADNARLKQQLTETQQKAILEKEMLARHLEAIEADMMEREASFVQIQRERENMAHTLQNQDGKADRVPVELIEDLRKSKNELRRRGAQVGVLEHEQAELLKRLTLSQESILERDGSLEVLEKKYVDLEVLYKKVQLDLESKDQEIFRMKESRSALEVELSSAKEEKKTFDSALQTLKEDMGRVEKSFRFMKQELDSKKEELNKLKSQKQRKNEKIAELSREEIRQEVIEEMNQRADVQVHQSIKPSGHNAHSEAAVSSEELQNLKLQNSQLANQLQELRLAGDESIKEMQVTKDSMQAKLAALQEELLMLKSEKQVDDEDKLAAEKELMVSKERVIELELNVQALTEDKLRLSSQQATAEESFSTSAVAGSSSAEELEIQKVRDINTELRNKLADLQRESHKEIAKQKSKVLKLGKDLEMTLRDHRDSQHHLQAKVADLTAKYTSTEETRARLEAELGELQGRFSLNLDEKTQQLQTELQSTKSELSNLLEVRHTLETELREIRSTYTREVEIYKERVSVLEVEVRTTKEKVVVQKQAMDNSRQLMLELEKEKGKLAGILQNHSTLKEHTSSLEHQLAKRESSVVELSSHANEEMLKKDKDITTLREKLKELQAMMDVEKKSLKDSKKQLMTEKGSHVKLKHKMETLWSEHVQLQMDLDQKHREQELMKSRFDEMVQKEVKYKSDLDVLRTELQEAKIELERLRVQSEERLAKDPVIQGQIKTLEWQVEEKTTELTAVTQQLHLVEERQTTELGTLKSTLQANSTELSALREELSATKQEKSTLQAKIVELKGALKASVEQAKSQDGTAAQPNSGVSAFDISAIENLLVDTKPVTVQSKPLTFLQATLSSLRGEISTLQDQVDEHTSTVQHSSMAWKEIEEQVRDLREVCKSSAAGRASSQSLVTVTTATLPADVLAKMKPPSAEELLQRLTGGEESLSVDGAEKTIYV